MTEQHTNCTMCW